MSLSKNVRVGQIEVVEDGTIFVKEFHDIIENGSVVATTIHRKTYSPAIGVPADEHPMVVSIASVVQTPAVKAAYDAAMDAKRADMMRGNTGR